MASTGHKLRRVAVRFAGLPTFALFGMFWAAVALSHVTLLWLPYYWDEAGYYIPAALDFYHRFALIPQFTNAHPPLPNVVLGTFWHLVGYHIPATRLLVCAVAAAGLLAVFRIALEILGPAAAVAVTALTAVYPIWFVQSTLAHADIFAAAFSLWALALYFRSIHQEEPTGKDQWKVAVLFSLSALSKETAILYPLTLAALHAWLWLRCQNVPALRLHHLRWTLANVTPALPLAAWYLYHWSQTGFVFGNATYLRYNATANLSLRHVVVAFGFRFLHLFWQRNIWIPLAMALACLLLRARRPTHFSGRDAPFWTLIAVLIAANWIAFSVLGGALLTRYLLPVYPLLLLACVAIWRSTTGRWPWLVAASAIAFSTALWWSPAFAFAPEDNLTYRDMIVVHQHAIAFLESNFPEATVLTSFPGAGELKRPELGYAGKVFRTTEIDNFSAAEVAKAVKEPEQFDTAFVFTTQYRPPALASELERHPHTIRGRQFAAVRDLHPEEIAAILHGRVIWQEERNGEWAAILRFDRTYEAHEQPPGRFAPVNGSAGDWLKTRQGVSLMVLNGLEYSKPSTPHP